VLPISKSIIKGAAFLKKGIPVRYNPFNAVISILTALDDHFKSLYLFGSRPQTLHVAERNVRATFPQLTILGRYPGYYAKSIEPDVIQAIYKSSPSLVLMSEGIKEKDCWAWRRHGQFSSSIFIYYKESLEIFSKRIKRVSEKTFERGNEIYHEIIRNPLKIFLIFPFLWYILILIWYRLFKKR
ncbi:MAG: WecB/TagA/CpsF family glycosyltransferase, partial [Treponemataceae bacterium]|nr:WecB/TagA/CpsF family glycosyltransferase [Treponemataceae bacterium]